MVSRSTRGTIPHEVPFSFVDYSVAGVTRFLVDFHFREAAINFEDSDRRVNISLADFGMESGTTADPNSTRKAFKKELECVPYFNAPPPGSHCSLLLTTVGSPTGHDALPLETTCHSRWRRVLPASTRSCVDIVTYAARAT